MLSTISVGRCWILAESREGTRVLPLGAKCVDGTEVGHVCGGGVARTRDFVNPLRILKSGRVESNDGESDLSIARGCEVSWWVSETKVEVHCEGVWAFETMTH